MQCAHSNSTTIPTNMSEYNHNKYHCPNLTQIVSSLFLRMIILNSLHVVFLITCIYIGSVAAKTPLFVGTEMPMFTPLIEAGTPLVLLAVAMPVKPSFDPVAALPTHLVKRILEFKFIEMVEMLPDTWQ